MRVCKRSETGSSSNNRQQAILGESLRLHEEPPGLFCLAPPPTERALANFLRWSFMLLPSSLFIYPEDASRKRFKTNSRTRLFSTHRAIRRRGDGCGTEDGFGGTSSA